MPCLLPLRPRPGGLVRLHPDDIPSVEERGLDGLMGWVRTTWHLYLDRLPEEARPAFVAELANRYVERYPSPDGRIHVPTVRLEVEGVKPPG